MFHGYSQSIFYRLIVVFVIFATFRLYVIPLRDLISFSIIKNRVLLKTHAHIVSVNSSSMLVFYDFFFSVFLSILLHLKSNCNFRISSLIPFNRAERKIIRTTKIETNENSFVGDSNETPQARNQVMQ